MDLDAALSAIVAKKEQTAISKPRDVQLQLSLIKTMTGLAEARQASVSSETLELYASHLSDFDPGEVRAAVREFALRPRKEGETAFPSLGELIAAIRYRIIEANKKRIDAQRKTKAEQDFWNWVDEQVEDTGRSEQQVLDSIKTPGYVGRKAR